MRLKTTLAGAALAVGVGVGGTALSASPVAAQAAATPAVTAPVAAAPAAPAALNRDTCTNAPDSGPTWNFHDACLRHDNCYANKPYGNSQWGRLRCDAVFWNDMMASCNSRYSWYDPRRYACREVADVYFSVVVAAGWYYW